MYTIRLRLTITFTSKWHCGSGEGGLLSNRLISRDSRNRPYIPGSTLKGVIREQCEQLSRALEFPPPADPHDPSLNHPGRFRPLNRVTSPVDAIFGNNYEEGGLFFRDARWSDADAALMARPGYDSQTQTRTQRYRLLGTVKEKHLFTTEYAHLWEAGCTTTIDGAHHHLKSFGDGDLPYAYCLLIAAILSVDRLGGDKTTGAGRVRISIDSPFWFNERRMNLDEVFIYLEKDVLPEGISHYQEMLQQEMRKRA